LEEAPRLIQQAGAAGELRELDLQALKRIRTGLEDHPPPGPALGQSPFGQFRDQAGAYERRLPAPRGADDGDQSGPRAAERRAEHLDQFACDPLAAEEEVRVGNVEDVQAAVGALDLHDRDTGAATGPDTLDTGGQAVPSRLLVEVLLELDPGVLREEVERRGL